MPQPKSKMVMLSFVSLTKASLTISINRFICLNLSYLALTILKSGVKTPKSTRAGMFSPSLKIYSFFLLFPLPEAFALRLFLASVFLIFPLELTENVVVTPALKKQICPYFLNASSKSFKSSSAEVLR